MAGQAFSQKEVSLSKMEFNRIGESRPYLRDGVLTQILTSSRMVRSRLN